jgi:hypothetical protein
MVQTTGADALVVDLAPDEPAQWDLVANASPTRVTGDVGSLRDVRVASPLNPAHLSRRRSRSASR